MYSDPSFVILGLKEIVYLYVKFLLHLQKTHLTSKGQTLSMPQKHLVEVPPPPASQCQVRMTSLKDSKYIKLVLIEFLKIYMLYII